MGGTKGGEISKLLLTTVDNLAAVRRPAVELAAGVDHFFAVAGAVASIVYVVICQLLSAHSYPKLASLLR